MPCKNWWNIVVDDINTFKIVLCYAWMDGHYWCCFEAWWDYCDCPHFLIDPIWHTDCTRSQNAFCYLLCAVWWCEWYFSSQYLSACDALNVLHTIVSRAFWLLKKQGVTSNFIFWTRKKNIQIATYHWWRFCVLKFRISKFLGLIEGSTFCLWTISLL